jgi:signal peptide peptidase SppA
MAGEIRAARSKKPVVAAISGIGASGAYWLASQADEVVVTPSGLVGSIGVVSAHEDVSAAAEAKGVRVTLISAGKYKTEGNSLGPLSDEGLAHAQSMVDEFYGMFVSDVAKGRRVPVDDVRNGYGEGRVVNARAAVASNLVDRIATVEDVVGELLSASAASSPAAALAPTISFVETDAEVAEIDAETADAEAAYFLAGADAEDYRAAAAARADAEFLAIEGDDETLASISAAVDNSTWDGNRAMGQCSSASDYRSICAGERTTGEPDERQHWALPHHYLGRGPNAAGVRNALARLPQTQGLANRGAAESHLRGHMREISPESSADAPDWLSAIEAELAIQSVPISRKSE